MLDKVTTMEQKLNIHLDKDNSDVLLEGEYSLLVEERTRRSNEQTEYLKFVLIGIVGQFALFMFELLNTEQSVIASIEQSTIELALLIISAGVVALTTIIFLFWLDHALTIATIDKYFQKKEEQNEVFGWYAFRQKYSKATYFNFFGFVINLMEMKIALFKLSIFISFLTPPVIFVLIASFNTSLTEYKEIVTVINYSFFAVFTTALIFGLAAWTFSGKGIYEHKVKKIKKR